MGLDSAIEWTHHTWNPWQGCHKVSPGCKNCYMYRDKRRYGQDPMTVVRSKPGTFRAPLRRTGKRAMRSGERVFVCSWSDFFHADADAWRADAWQIMRERTDLVFIIVTKRIERARECLPPDWGSGWAHVWLLVSAEDQEHADKRVPELLATPAAVRGISAEPLLGQITLRREWLGLGHPFYPQADDDAICTCGKPRAYHLRIDWVITGGESGEGARPSLPIWHRALRDPCIRWGIAFFFKQWGEFVHTGDPSSWVGCSKPVADYPQVADAEGGYWLRVGKKAAGSTLDGREWKQFPAQAA